MTPGAKRNTRGSPGSQRRRRRLRGILSGKSGRTIGLTSLAAPLIGFVLNDLKKPDSITRRLVGRALERFLPAKSEQATIIDVTDEAEILDDGNEATRSSNRDLQNGKEIHDARRR